MGLKRYLRRLLATDDQIAQQPCTEVGHNWQTQGYDTGIREHPNGALITSKERRKCTKCGSIDYGKRQPRGKVTVNQDTGEMEVSRFDD